MISKCWFCNHPVLCRAQKLVDTTMSELGVPGPPAVPTRATCGAYLALRAEVIAMLEMRKTLQHRSVSLQTYGTSERSVVASTSRIKLRSPQPGADGIISGCR